MSLRWRWALTLAGVALGAVVVVGVAAAALVGRGLRQEVDRSLLQRVSVLELASVDDFAQRTRDAVVPRRLLRPLLGPDFEVQVIRADGEIAFGMDDRSRLPVEEADLAVARGGRGSAIRTVSTGGAGYRMVTVPLRSGAIQLARDLAPIEQLLGTLGRRLFMVGLISAAGAAAAGWWLAGRALKPIEELTTATERITRINERAAPVPAGGGDEVARLSSSFATMVTALEDSRRQQQQLITDASHELRTPLTGLRTNLEVLARRPGLAPEARVELVNAALDEVGEMGALVSELVDLATDAGASPEQPVTSPLHELAEPVTRRYGRVLDRKVTLEGLGEDVTFRPSRFERALGNLIDNAAKWSDPDDPIEVSVDWRTIEVRDHGPGIPEGDLDRIFDRFYRSATARAMPGSGLGLAIVKQTVEAHGGRVFARNHPDGGAVVGFSV